MANVFTLANSILYFLNPMRRLDRALICVDGSIPCKKLKDFLKLVQVYKYGKFDMRNYKHIYYSPS